MKWEYHVAVIATSTARLSIINELGAKGWELVGVYNCEFYFKRPVPE